MRFAFISTMLGSPWGASEELWSQAAVQLSQGGHEVQASVAYWPCLSERVADLRRKGVTVETYSSYHAGKLRHFWDRASLSYRRLYRRLKRFRPDLVVISQGDITGGFDWARVCKEGAIPYSIMVHSNSESWWFREQFDEAVAVYCGARRIFCVSRNNLDLLRLQVGESLHNGEVVWNPFNLFREPAPAWPDESDGMRLACVSRIELGHKGQDLLLQVLARPEWRNRPFELNLFGTGPDEKVLRRLGSRLQLTSVHFHGHVNDVRGIWEQNHLLVLPSRYEGVPLSVVEAMWCARPAVVTDVGRTEELCLDNETGFVAPAATVSSFGNALERAWERRKDWPRMGQAARTRAEKQVPANPVGEFCERLKACASNHTPSFT
jgi:glycosyltransferase involved in cell wall biosynthesis